MGDDYVILSEVEDIYEKLTYADGYEDGFNDREKADARIAYLIGFFTGVGFVLLALWWSGVL